MSSQTELISDKERAEPLERERGAHISSQASRKPYYVTVICFQLNIEDVFLTSTFEQAKAIYERETELSFSDLGKWAEGGREEGLDEIQGDFENSGIFEVELDGSPSGRRKV